MRVAISGVSRGIGEGLAKAVLAAGGAVLGFGRKEPSWRNQYEGRFSFFSCDMADANALQQACSAVREPIDVLVCNAATFANNAWTAESFTPEALAEAFAVNSVAPLIMAKTLRANLQSGDRRLIIMMSTGNASLEGNREGTMLGYRLSKSALNQAVRNLAAEWSEFGFTVVALNPGWVKTDMGGPNAEMSVEQAANGILHFIDEVSVRGGMSGAFVNTDGSTLPW